MNPNCNECQDQRNRLLEAGNTLECRDISFHNWDKNDLLPFVRGREPLQMINCNTPAVKRGEIDPILLSFDEALTLLTETPELIRGPLVQVDDLYIQGASDKRLQRYRTDADTSNLH